MTQQLPSPDEGLVLLDGTVIDPATGQPKNKSKKKKKKYVEVPSNSEAQRLVMETHRKTVDLPDTPDRMNPISIVVCYHLFGLNSAQIAIATKLTLDQVEHIKTQDAYLKMYDEVTKRVLESDTDRVRNILVRGQTRAAERMVEFVDDEDEPSIAFNASKEILRMTGAAGKDEQNNDANVLNINFIRKGDKDETVRINIGKD